MKQSVSERSGQAVLWYRATEPRGVSHICKLEELKPLAITGLTPDIERGTPVLRRQSLRVLSLMSDQIGQENPRESEAVRKDLSFR